jgi:hypothetical protein
VRQEALIQMTKNQLEHEIRKELGVNGRLAQLLIDYGQCFANEALRLSYKTNDAGLLIRQAGMAEGVERFVSGITKAPTSAQQDPK